MDAKKIGLLGGRGYVGQEILDLISNHEYLNISSIFSFSKGQLFKCLPGSSSLT